MRLVAEHEVVGRRLVHSIGAGGVFVVVIHRDAWLIESIAEVDREMRGAPADAAVGRKWMDLGGRASV